VDDWKEEKVEPFED